MKKLKMTAFAIAVFAAATMFGAAQNTYAQNGSFEWSGTVDDTVQIRIHNRNARTKTISGRDYNDDRYNFNGRAPRDNANVSVNKRNGRGRIFVVQQPNRRNNFTTIIQIVDAKSGTDRYRFTVNWN